MTSNYELTKCPTCGESKFEELETGYKCKTCDSVFFKVSEKEMHDLYTAQRYLELYEFTAADRNYRNILNETNDEKTKVMCYFGRLLAYFGVVYVKDFNGKLIITISNYDPDYTSIKETTYYEQIKESKYSDLYTEQLERLDEEYKRIKDELSKDIVYDVFICSKISPLTRENPNADPEFKVKDCLESLLIHENLTKKGLKVFYSEKDLRGIQYDAQIYSALIRSKNMIVVTSKKEYLESAWVESEWQRWINFIKKDLKDDNSFYLYIINDNHFELPQQLEKAQKFSSSLKLVDMVEKSVDKKENRHKVILEKDLNLLVDYKKDIEQGNRNYVVSEILELYEKVLNEYDSNTEKYDKELSMKDKTILVNFRNNYKDIKEINNEILSLKETNRKNNCRIVRDEYNQLDTFSKTLIDENYKLFKLHEEILSFEEMVENTLIFKNDVMNSLEKINKVWEKYQTIEYSYEKMGVFTEVFPKNNQAYQKLLSFEKKMIDYVVKNISDIDLKNNQIVYNRNNFNCLNDYYKQREYISDNGKEQYHKLLEETDKKYEHYANVLDSMSKEIKKVENSISSLQPGSKKIYEVRDRFYSLTGEQQNNVQNKSQLMTLLDNYNRDVRYSFNMTSRVLNIFTLILSIVLFICLIGNINISITESISLNAVLSVIGMILVIISSFSTIMLKLKTYGEKISARNGRIVWYIFNYVVVVLLIVLTMIFMPKLYEGLGNFRYKTLLVPLVLILLSTILNISNIKKFDTNDKLIDSKLFSGKLYLVLFILLISLSNVSYKIEYDLSGGEVFGEPKSYGNIVSDIKLPTPTKEGYEFGGWYDNGEYEGEALEAITVGTTGNVKLYAKWSPVKYTIEYELKAGELENGIYNYTLEEEVELPNAFKKGYEFKGWYENNSYDGNPITKIEKGSTKNFKLYARWERIEYTIEYNLNGGKWGNKKGTETYNVLTEEELVIPEYAGYTFVGWYEDSNFNGSKVVKIEEGTTGNKVYYAKWSKVVYTIKFSTPDGNSVSEIKAFPNETITLPTPTHNKPAYYTFKGWSYNGQTIKELKVTGNVTLTAVWTKNLTYTVTFKVPSGKSVSSKEVLPNETITLPTPTHNKPAYYTFKGWSYNGQTIKELKVTGNITLEVVWEQKYKDYTYITNVTELKAINSNPSGKYMLINDIDLSESVWSALSTFSGELIGNNCKITGMKINVPSNAGPESNDFAKFGLFEKIEKNGYVANIVFEDCFITGTSFNYISIGIVCGENVGTIEDCSFSNNTINMDSDSKLSMTICYAGIVTGTNNGTISNVSLENQNNINVDSDTQKDSCNDNSYSAVAVIGGVSGYNYGTISNCKNSGNSKLTARSCHHNYYTGSVKFLVACGGITGITEGSLSNNQVDSSITLNSFRRSYSSKTIFGVTLSWSYEDNYENCGRVYGNSRH